MRKVPTQQAVYYLLRIFQRIALILQVFFAGLTWLMVVNTVMASKLAEQTVGHQWRDFDSLNAAITTTTNRLSIDVGIAGAVAVTLTIALACLPRVRKYEKHLVVDSLVLIVVVGLLVMFAQLMVERFIWANLVG